ncbi:hypothetical protein GCM10020254_65940 [Streptomyces goshikiensis]
MSASWFTAVVDWPSGPSTRNRAGGQGQRQRTAHDQPAEDQGQHEQGGQQADAEHGVAGEQQRLAGLAGGQVGYQQRAHGGGDHRGDHGEQPDRGGLVRLDLVPDHHQVRDGDGYDQPGRGAGGEQDGVGGDGRPGADQVLADGEGAGADGQQRHRETAVEGGDGGVEEMGAGLVAVVDPVPGASGQQDGEGGGGQRPEQLAGHALAGQLVREARAGVRDDRRAHDGGVPVGSEVPERGSLVGQGRGGAVAERGRARAVAMEPASRRSGRGGRGHLHMRA